MRSIEQNNEFFNIGSQTAQQSKCASVLTHTGDQPVVHLIVSVYILHVVARIQVMCSMGSVTSITCGHSTLPLLLIVHSRLCILNLAMTGIITTCMCTVQSALHDSVCFLKC